MRLFFINKNFIKNIAGYIILKAKCDCKSVLYLVYFCHYKYSLSIKMKVRNFMKVSWEIDLKIGIGNSFEIEIEKWEIVLKIAKWNANKVLLLALSLLFLYSSDTYLWKKHNNIAL